jgi:hypothetical protein
MSPGDDDKPPKKQQLLPMKWCSTSQSAVNDLVTNFVVGDLQAFSVMESPDFIKLVTTAYPGRTVLTRKTLVGRCINSAMYCKLIK